MASTREERMQERMRGAQRHLVEDVSFGFVFPAAEPEPETNDGEAERTASPTPGGGGDAGGGATTASSAAAAAAAAAARSAPNTSAKRRKLDSDGSSPVAGSTSPVLAKRRLSGSGPAMLPPALPPSPSQQVRTLPSTRPTVDAPVAQAPAPLPPAVQPAQPRAAPPPPAEAAPPAPSKPSAPAAHPPKPQPQQRQQQLVQQKLQLQPKPQSPARKQQRMPKPISPVVARMVAREAGEEGYDDSEDEISALPASPSGGAGSANPRVKAMARAAGAKPAAVAPPPRADAGTADPATAARTQRRVRISDAAPDVAPPSSELRSFLRSVSSGMGAGVAGPGPQDSSPLARVAIKSALKKGLGLAAAAASAPPRRTPAAHELPEPRSPDDRDSTFAEDGFDDVDDDDAAPAEDIPDAEAARRLAGPPVAAGAKKRKRLRPSLPFRGADGSPAATDRSREGGGDGGEDELAAQQGEEEDDDDDEQEEDDRRRRAAAAAAKRRRRGEEELADTTASPAVQRQPKQKLRAKQKKQPTAGGGRRPRIPVDVEAGVAARGGEEGGAAEGQGGHTIPITVQRYLVPGSVRSASGAMEEDPEAEDILAMDTLPFSGVSSASGGGGGGGAVSGKDGGVNVVDVLAQLCEEKLAARLTRLEDAILAAEEAEHRRELRVKHRAILAFRGELRGRLLEHTIALDNLSSLAKQLRTAQKERLQLREEVLRLRAEREQVGLRTDAVRLRHAAVSASLGARSDLSARMHDVELAVEKGRQQDDDDDERGDGGAGRRRKSDDDEVRNLEIAVARVVGMVGGGPPGIASNRRGDGFVAQVKDFNAFLERAAKTLEAKG